MGGTKVNKILAIAGKLNFASIEMNIINKHMKDSEYKENTA
jgi:hypothetical protein